jgi:putative ABC transport system substrate-binding protein
MNAGRRAALFALAAGAIAPRFAKAAPRKRLAFMNFGPVDSGWKEQTDPFVAELARQGFVEGQNVEILREGFLAENQGRGPEPMAAKVAKRIAEIEPDVIVTDGPVFTLVLQLATRTIPIVTQTPDPVGAGFAKSIAKPGGNITGLTDGVEETSVKTMELVKRLLPLATRLAIFSDPRPAASRYAANFERAARGAGIEPVMILSKEHDEHAAALRGLPTRKIPAGLNAASAGHPRKLAEVALAARVPLFAPEYYWTRFGYLAAYSAYEPAPQARMAAIAAHILRGANPGDIPFQFPQQFRLELNRRTAGVVGVKLPADLLLRADKVIE